MHRVSPLARRTRAAAPPGRATLAVACALTLLAGCRKDAPPAPPPPPAASAAPAAAEPVAEVEALSDADAYFAVIEPHFQRVSIYAPPEQFLTELASTPEKARHLLAAHWCASEISNGGFQQLFSSSAGVLVPEAIVALRTIGLPDNAAVVEEAAKIFGATYPREAKRRHKVLDAHKRKSKGANPFAELDEKFFAALKRHRGGFDAVAAAYARQGS